MGAVGTEAIRAAAKASPLQVQYGQTIDRESAYELLKAKLIPADSPPARAGDKTAPKYEPKPLHWWTRLGRWLKGIFTSPLARSFARSAGTAVGREITRGALGTGRRRR